MFYFHVEASDTKQPSGSSVLCNFHKLFLILKSRLAQAMMSSHQKLLLYFITDESIRYGNERYVNQTKRREVRVFFIYLDRC